MKTVVPLRYGTAFKKGFSDPQVFTSFVKAVLDIDIEIDHVETEKSFLKAVSPIGVRFDLFAEDKKNRLIVEIQHEHHADHYERFLYYHSAALIEMKRSSTDYRPPRTLYTIVVQTSSDVDREDMVTIDLDPIGRRRGKLNRLSHKIVFIFSQHIYPDTPLALREWLRALDDSLDSTVDEQSYSNQSIRRLFELVEEDSLSPDERAKLIEDNYIEIARAEAEAKGKAEATVALAMEMLRSGISLEQVANITRLDSETLHSLIGEEK